jgi:hypothetical protein
LTLGRMPRASSAHARKPVIGHIGLLPSVLRLQ